MMNESEYIINDFGNKFWFNESNQYHNEYGPAVIWKNGNTEWYFNGKLHRLDGPAVIWNIYEPEWWINGINVTDLITQWAKYNNIDLNNLTDVDIALIKISWADYSGKIK